IEPLPGWVLHASRRTFPHDAFNVVRVGVQPDPARAAVEPGIHLGARVRRVSDHMMSLGFKYQDHDVREAANRVPYVTQRVFAACALFDFLNGCDVRWPDGAEDFSIASFADDRREVEGFTRLTGCGRIVDRPESVVVVFVERTVA